MTVGPVRKAFIHSAGQDTNGNGMRIKQGFDRLAGDWHVDTLAMRRSWIRYPEDHDGTHGERARTAARLYRDADVVHLFNTLDGWQNHDQRDGTRLCKPVLLHHHGTNFRNEPTATAKGAEAIGAIQVASTIDLVILAPNVTWLPAIYNLDEIAAMRQREYQSGDRLRIAHAPTNRNVKGTEQVLAAVAELGDSVEFDLIERVPWAECLSRIARADLVIDQMTLGYGSLAVEAWGMGIPVVSGVTSPLVRAEMLRRWRRLPFAEVVDGRLLSLLKRLAKSADARAEAAAIGEAHARRYHDEPKIVAQLRGIYAGLQPTRYPVSTWRGWRPARARA